MKIPKRPSLLKAQFIAEALCEEFGAACSLKRCAQERALARRARSRRRFEFWSEVSQYIESGAIRVGPLATASMATANRIAEPAEPKSPSLSKALLTAEALCKEFGVDRSRKRCSQELALARRARSRQRFEFWSEVSQFIDTNARRAEPPASEPAAVAEQIADLAETFAAMAQNGNLPRLAHLLNLARTHAANVANTKEIHPPINDMAVGVSPRPFTALHRVRGA